MSATVREGSALRLVIHDTAEVELVPVMARGGGDRVLLAVYRGTVDRPDTRRLDQRLELRVGVPATLRGEPRIGVVVDGVRRVSAAPSPASFTSARGLRAPFSTQPQNCCVCCGELCACACGVGMSCGSCCMPGCCPVEPTATDHGPPEILTGASRVASAFRRACAPTLQTASR